MVFPGITTGTLATDSLYDDESVRRIMERHYEMMKKFREAEFSKKLQKARDTRLKGYEDKIINEGDLVYYQNQDKKAWLGPVEVFSRKGNSVFLFANGSMKKIPRCNIQLCKPNVDEDFDNGGEVKTTIDKEPGVCRSFPQQNDEKTL